MLDGLQRDGEKIRNSDGVRRWKNHERKWKERTGNEKPAKWN